MTNFNGKEHRVRDMSAEEAAKKILAATTDDEKRLVKMRCTHRYSTGGSSVVNDPHGGGHWCSACGLSLRGSVW